MELIMQKPLFPVAAGSGRVAADEAQA